MLEREESRLSTEGLHPGQNLYHQAMNCIEKTGESPQAHIFGFLDCGQETIEEAVRTLGLSNEEELPSLSLRFEVSQKRSWLPGRKKVKILLEAKTRKTEARNQRFKTLTLVVAPNGNSQYKMNQKDWTIGPYGFIEKEKKKTIKPKRRATEREIESFRAVLSEIELQAMA